MFKQNLTACEGECPKCHSLNVEWLDSDIEDMYYCYKGQCEDCKTKFTEWYKLEYDTTEWWEEENESK